MNSTLKKKKLLFLYSELAGYFLSCLAELSDRGYEIHVIHFKINKEAPFQFSFSPNINFYSLEKYSTTELQSIINNISPDFIYCSGWIHKPYLKICKSLNKKIPVVLALDNTWRGTWRQKLAIVFGRILKSIFTHVWTAGERQKSYALKLGFNELQIISHVYSGDIEKFNVAYHQNISSKEKSFPKRFLFVGRYNKVKGIELLLETYNEIKENLNGWELWCCGAGELNYLFDKYPSVKNLGFIQPDDLKNIISQTGVFVLPSQFEPWGVAVHEFAASGFPLICSSEVGAAELFLKNNHNGFLFDSENKNELAACLLKISKMSDADLNRMGEESMKLAMMVTPKTWADKIEALL